MSNCTAENSTLLKGYSAKPNKISVLASYKGCISSSTWGPLHIPTVGHTGISFIDKSGGESIQHAVGLLWGFSGGIARPLHCECWDNKEGSLLEQSGSIYPPLSLPPTSCVTVEKPWIFPMLRPPSVNVGNFGVNEDEGDIVWEPLTGSGHPWRLPGCCWCLQVGDVLCREECYCKPVSQTDDTEVLPLTIVVPSVQTGI